MLPHEIKPLNMLCQEYASYHFHLVNSSLLYSDLFIIVTTLGKSSQPHYVRYLAIFLKENMSTHRL